MNPDSPEARIAEENLKPGAGGGVALQHGGDVVANVFKQGHRRLEP
jgi:hypothetical protein